MQLMRRDALLALAVVLAADSLSAEPVLTESFEQQGKWRKIIKGKGSIELVEGGVKGKCLKVASQEQALAYYSIELDPKRVRGKRLIIRARVKLDNVVIGPQTYSTAKLHVGIGGGKQMQHRAQRFVGTRDWHHQVLIAPIPDDADRVVLDLGIQNGTGAAWFDELSVDDGVKQHHAVSLKPAANASYRGEVLGCGVRVFDRGGPDLRGLPVADIKLGGVDFYVMHPGENYGRACIALRGAKRPDLPARIETVLRVDAKGSRLLFLQTAAWADPTRNNPCLVYTIHYADGKSVDVPIREGIAIGALAKPEDLPNWKVAWTAKQEGHTIGLGITEWKNPRPAVPIQWIRLTTPGAGAVPIVVAISLDPKGT